MAGPAGAPRTSQWWTVVIFAALLAFLFRNSFVPDLTVFSNDGPLGVLNAASGQYPEGFFGVWNDLNWIGSRGIGASPNFSSLWGWIAGPVLFSKFYSPMALFLVGFFAWFMFRQMGFKPAVCLLGGLAALLNSNVFSIACWGLPSWSLSRAMIFLALGILACSWIRHSWMRASLAGLAVGMGVMEGFDVGAIYSLYVAAWVAFLAWTNPSQSAGRRVARAAASVALVACFAVFIAAQSLSALVSTQVQGVTGTSQDTRTKEERWDWATQGSLPKIETLRIVIPGLFGYRMDTPEGGNYWGEVGRQPGWEQHHQGLPRHSGMGEYAGILVVLLAAWAFAQSLRGDKSPFDLRNRQFIWFWAGAGGISLLLAYGRHAPFYQLIYHLPYFSTIRNPFKFLNLLQVGLVILFGYGLQDLFIRYLGPARSQALGLTQQLSTWWRSPANVDKRWARAVLIVFGLAVGALLIYSASRTELEKYLATQAFDAARAKEIAGFSIGELGWFVFFLGLSGGLMLVILSGWFSGGRARFAAVLLGLVLVTDLARANQPWIIYYNYRAKYASNPILDFLREKPYENRTASRLAPMSPNYLVAEQLQPLFSGVAEEWLQQHYQFYNIQSLDVVQMPRMPEMDETYLSAVFSPGLSSGDILQLGSLVAKLTNHTDGVSQILWERFSPEIRTRLEESAGAESVKPSLRDELNRILRDSTFYDPGHFAGVKLSTETQSHLNPNAPRRDPFRLNRLLLQDAYPKELARKSQVRSYARLWQLTNTRFILGMAGFLDFMNQEMDPSHHSFRVHTAFDFAPRSNSEGASARVEDITTVVRPQGQFALFEYGAALPRAKFYSDWQVTTNDLAALERLGDATFDPQRQVLVAPPSFALPAPGGGPTTGTVSITRYQPKQVSMKVAAAAPGVLLLNQKIDPNWTVTVDGKPETLLRCNYIMQGVHLPAGEHQVEFRFAPPHWMFYVSLSAIGVGALLCGFLAFGPKPAVPRSAEAPAAPAPSSPQSRSPQSKIPNPKSKI